jgi:hypothetical protein
MGLKWMTTVEGDITIVTEADKCIPQQSRKPRAVLAYGTKTLVLAGGAVVAVVHAHLKTSHENIANPNVITSEK